MGTGCLFQFTYSDIGNISFGPVLFANGIFARHDSAVLDIPKYGQ